jgi:RHS repeat-associated protein
MSRIIRPLVVALPILLVLGATPAFTATHGGMNGDAAVRGSRGAAMMACSNSNGSISPCTSSASVPVNTSGNTASFTITNNSSSYKEGGVTCSVTAPVTSCSVNPIDYGLNAHTSQTNVVTYATGATTGTGTVTVTTGGTLGSLTATLTVTVTPPPYAVDVAQQLSPFPAEASAANSYYGFTVQNTGANSATFNLTVPVCSGGASACSVVAPTQVTLASGQTVYPEVVFTAGPTGTTGTVQLAATYTGNSAITDAASIVENSVPSASVGPDNKSVNLPASTASSEVFGIGNSHTTTATYNISVVCPPQITGCSVTPSSVILGAQSGTSVTASFTSGTGNTTGKVTVFAKQTTDTLNRDSGWVNVTVPPVYPCSDVGTTVSPCTASFSRSYGTTGLMAYFQVTNNYPNGGVQNEGFSCQVTGKITSCSVQNNTLLNPLEMKIIPVTFSTSDSAGTGTLVLTVDGGYQTVAGTNTITVTKPFISPLHLLTLSPHYQARETDPSRTDTALFAVKNAGQDTAWFRYTRTCTGSGFVSGCTPATDSVLLNPGASGNVPAIYATSSTIGAIGKVSFVVRYASDTTKRDSAGVDVTVTRGTTGVSVSQVNPGSTVDRDLCLTISAGAGAGYECGDLRLVHAMPAVRTYNKPRAPTLLYNSAHAHPIVVIRADETLPTGGAIPTTVTAVLKGAAAETLATGSWNGNQWASGTTRRIAVFFHANTKATGIYPYTLQITRTYPGPTTSTDTTSGEFVVVNRSTSVYGPGWWMAGLEQLFLPGTANMLWVGGDGSARRYTQVNDSTWGAVSVNRPDSIKKRGTNFERILPNGLIVRFDNTGRHIVTMNRLGQLTTFKYTNAGAPFRLDSIVVPPAAAGLKFTFSYDSVTGYGWRLRRVTAPPVGAQQRFDSLRYNASNQVTTLRHLDGTTVGFGYDANVALNRVISRTNERGYATTFAFDSGGVLKQVSVPLDATTNAVTAFVPAETRGLAGTAALPSELATTRLDGPRTDVGDTTSFWLDRFGAPRRTRNALGDETVLTRSNSTYSALVTRLRQPNGQILGATYDARGNLATSTDTTGYDPARALYPTTRYTWDQKWDVVTRVINPENDSDSASFDAATGNLLWRRDGRGDSTKTNFTYWPIGDPYGGQLKTVISPAGSLDSLFYDATLGNLQRVREPQGRYTLYTADGIGRVTQTVTPVTASGVVSTSFGYPDLLDQDTLSLTVAGSDTVQVRTHYDVAGQVDTLRKRSGPDINAIDTIKTVFGYDRANRKIAETLVGFNTITWTYDAAGNLLSGGRKPTSNTYDALGRLATRSGGDYSTFTYDAAGQILTANNSAARITRTYNLNGTLRSDELRIATRKDQDFSQHIYGIRYGYDLDGRLIWLKHPTIASATDSARYAYNPQAGFLTSVTDILGNRFTFGYDREMRPVNDTMVAQSASRVTEMITYDSLSQMNSRLQQLASGGAGSQIHFDWLKYDLRGKVVKNQNTGDTISYAPIGYVSRATYVTATGPEAYLVDALGNRKQLTTSVTYHHPNDVSVYWPHSDRLRYVAHVGSPYTDTTTYWEDTNGRVYEERTSHLYGPNTTPYHEYGDVLNTYDAEGNLTASAWTLDSIPNLSSHYKHYRRLESYRYDALGRRVWQQMIRDTTCQNHDRSSGCRNETTRTVWDGSQVLYEIRTGADANGDLSESDGGNSTFTGIVGYTNAGGIDAPLDLFKGSQVVVLYRDWQGRFDKGTCPTAFCDGAFPYFPATSETIYGSGATDAQPLGPPSWYGSVITGMTDGSGYQYKRNRYYDPATGRFTQEDPIGLAGGLNAYGYGEGDPVSYSDPFGLCGILDPSSPCLVSYAGLNFAFSWGPLQYSSEIGTYNSPTYSGVYATTMPGPGFGGDSKNGINGTKMPSMSVTVVGGQFSTLGSFVGNSTSISAHGNYELGTGGGALTRNNGGTGWSADAGLGLSAKGAFGIASGGIATTHTVLLSFDAKRGLSAPSTYAAPDMTRVSVKAPTPQRTWKASP